ncbi:MAG: DNRLRE domain-containing protein [Myxococcota bacterium]|nr:DNRLRE domain-containing protein [Myxococcota bacterium]MDW8361407.1 DNRLRE domain-containing protein [Myxococcales bacterium]
MRWRSPLRASWIHVVVCSALGCGGTHGTSDASRPVDAGGDVVGARDGSARDATVEPVLDPDARLVVFRGARAGDRLDWQRSVPFWAGGVGSRRNAIDGRILWTERGLAIRVAVYDRHIYDEAGPRDDLERWDSLRLMIAPRLDATSLEGALRIDAQAGRHGTERTDVFRGSAAGWMAVSMPIGRLGAGGGGDGIELEKGYRGGERDESRGWHVVFWIGWRALTGEAGVPMGLRLGLLAFDRDDASGSRLGEVERFPLTAATETAEGWMPVVLADATIASREESGASPGHAAEAYRVAGQLPPHRPETMRTVVIREGRMGAVVENASVGASERLCSGDDAYNFGDGPASWGGETGRRYFHVQAQADYADWPCFARAYVRFPLDAVPDGAVVLSARLVLHHKQPTSGGDEGVWSLVHAFDVDSTLRGSSEPWTEADLSWNLAPLPVENLAASWGDRTGVTDRGWDALPPWSWDVTRAVRRRLAERRVSFALQPSDVEYHTGKEFVRSEDFPDWGNPEQRPRLEVTFADPP